MIVAPRFKPSDPCYPSEEHHPSERDIEEPEDSEEESYPISDSDLRELGWENKRFANLQELETAAEDTILGDVRRLVLGRDGRPREKMPDSVYHNTAVDTIADGCGMIRKAYIKIKTNNRVKAETGKTYFPDICLYGYNRCGPNRKPLYDQTIGDFVSPHVFFEFSWKTSESEERETIDTLMNEYQVDPNAALYTPRVGYVVKARFQRIQQGITLQRPSNLVGLDVYRVPRGCTLHDAENDQNGAQHWAYQPNGPEVLITITAAELGITGFWGWMFGGLKVKCSYLFKEIKEALPDNIPR